jgi:general stress protein CsbA
MSGKAYALLLFFLLNTLGILCKIPALYLMPVLAILFFIKEIPLQRKIAVWTLAGLSFGLVCLWYFYWVPYLVETYHNQLYFPRSIIEGLKEIISLSGGFFRNFYFNAFHSYVAFAAFVAGIYVVVTSRFTYLRWGLLMVTVMFLAFILKTGIVFPLHNYYIIPFVPVMALIAGMALDRLPARPFYFILLIIAAEGIANQQHDFFIKDKEGYKIAVEQLTGQYTGKDDLIVINGGQSPQEIYLAHRKGWSVTNDKINPATLQEYKNAGASYLVVDRRTYPDSISYLPMVAAENDFSLYSLRD